MHEHAARLRQDDHRSDWSISELVQQIQAGRLARKLFWSHDTGVGYYPVEAGFAPYDQEYFDNFVRNADTDIGRALMAARVDFVAQHYQGSLIDVGIGSGAFIEARRHARPMRPTFGYDVNPCGIEWLQQRRLFADPYAAPFEAATMWDVLEHMPHYPVLLDNVREWLFLSLPIFHDLDHVMRSKHFKPREHCWYFTRDGLVTMMKGCGFGLVAESTIETELGREDIGSFAFRRTCDA